MKTTLSGALILFALLLVSASAQESSTPPPHEHHSEQPDTSMAGMQMGGMHMDEHAESPLPSPHAGSGTGWQPASVPGHDWMWMRGGWELMAHGVIFTDYNQRGSPRGAGKAESVNWGMLMEQHKWGAGHDSFSTNVFGRVADLATSWVP